MLEVKIKENQGGMRICQTAGCGKILKPRQKKFCSRKCQGYRKHKSNKSKPFSKWPSWACEYCGKKIIIRDKITGTGRAASRLEAIKKEHYAKCKN